MGNPNSKEDDCSSALLTTLFEKEPSGITYRIPALIYLSATKTFLAFAEKRSSPSDNDAKILVVRRGTFKVDGSIQWSPCEKLSTAALPDHRTMNPCPVYERNTKTLFLFFICVLSTATEGQQLCTGRNKARLCYVSSSDGGQTWSQVKDLTESTIGKAVHKWATFAVGPGHGIQLESGRLIIPSYAYVPRCSMCLHIKVCSYIKVHPYVFCVYSDDFGQTWHIGHMLEKQSCECEMVEIIDDEGKSHLYCNARKSKGQRCEALSDNGGVSFNKYRLALELIEQPHGCQGSVISFPASKFLPKDKTESNACETSVLSPNPGTWLLFMHPTQKRSRKDMGVYLNRSPLQLSGWEQPWIIYSGPSGYSDLVCNEDKAQFSCLMECGEKSELEQIAFRSFTLNDVLSSRDTV